MRGNVVDMAVGIIIGGAFGKIITSFVSDVIMPPIGLLLGNVDFAQLVITLREKTEKADAVAIRGGLFVNTVLDFLIVAFCIFLAVKGMNRLRPKPELVPTTKDCPRCFSKIAIKATRCPQCTSELEAGRA